MSGNQAPDRNILIYSRRQASYNGMMSSAQTLQEWTRFWHHQALDVNLLQARFQRYAFTRHTHDYYVVAVVERGLQSFRHAGQKHLTPPDGLILINPGEMHTGEPADEAGFRYLAVYPTLAHMEAAAAELGDGLPIAPQFTQPRGDHPMLARQVRRLHAALRRNQPGLEIESLYLDTLTNLVAAFSDRGPLPPAGDGSRAVRTARDYIKAHFKETISLDTLAAEVGLSPYYLLRVFRRAVGLPPHSYQDSLRIQQAQHWLTHGRPLAAVAQALGYSSQSHFTQRFKQHIGVTPGRYAAEMAS